MLKHLHINNYALIGHLDIDFGAGFSVITGETGAGKSILLGALGLLLGQRADSKSIKDGAQRCVVEATFCLKSKQLRDFLEENDFDFDLDAGFDAEEVECIIRREVTKTGKSRAFINDTPATLTQLKELGDKLIDIHSQHQNLLISRENFQLQVLDIVASDSEELATYTALYRQMQKTERELSETQAAADAARTEQDYLQFQYDQLAEARLQAGEQDELESEQQTLEHAEDIKTALLQADSLLQNDETGLLNQLRETERLLTALTAIYPKAEELAERIASSRIELKDVAEEVTDHADRVDIDPERLAAVNERLSTIYDLQKKHRLDTVEDLLALQSQLEQRLQAITGSDERIAELQARLATERKQLQAKAERLTELRRKAARTVEQEMCQRLIPLGMPNVQLQVAITPLPDFTAQGLDKVAFLFSANKNTALQPISQVASGGEMARVMLSLKALISQAVSLPTIVFDEIDTGVSGHIAECMASIMYEMGAGGRQVISITHLPQIAACGTTHYRVYKQDDADGTTSHIVQLSEEERVTELAHMLSGCTLTQAAIDNAKELLRIRG